MKKLFLVLAVAAGGSMNAANLSDLTALPGKGLGAVAAGLSTASGYVQSGVDKAEGLVVQLPFGQHILNFSVGAAEGAVLTGGALAAVKATDQYSPKVLGLLERAKVPAVGLNALSKAVPGVAPTASMAALVVAQGYNPTTKKVAVARNSAGYWLGAVVGAAAVQLWMQNAAAQTGCSNCVCTQES